MGVVTLRVRPAFVTPPGADDYELSLTVDPATDDEGEDFTWTVALDRQGATPPVDEVYSFRIRTLNATEFAAEYPASTQATSADFQDGNLVATIIAAATDSGAISAVAASPGVRITVGPEWDGFAFTRTALDLDYDGSKISAFIIEEVSQGIVAAGADIAGAEIVGTFVEPAPPAQLATVTLDVDWVRVGAAAGVAIGTLQGFDSEGDPVTIDSATLLDDQEGRFVLDGLTLKTTAVVCDFEGSVSAFHQQTLGIPFYLPAVSATADGVTVQAQLRIRPRFAKIQSTGGTDVSIQTSTGGFRTALAAQVNNKKLVVDPNWIGVAETNANIATVVDLRTGLTIRGHVQWIGFMKDAAVELRRVSNVLIEDVQALAGADKLGASAENRDSFVIRSGQGIHIKHGFFGRNLDEVISVIGASAPSPWAYPRSIRISRTLMGQGLSATSDPANYVAHPEGTHTFGPLFYDHVMDIVVDKCVIVGFLQRSPCINPGRGYVIQNNFIAWYGDASSQWGIGINNSDNAVANNLGHTAIIRGNFGFPLTGNENRDKFIMTNRVGSGSFVYVGEGDEANHFFVPGPSLDLDPDPFDPADVFIRQGNAGSASSIIDWKPFETDMDDEYMPTSTLERHQAIYDDVVPLCGPHLRDANDNPIPGYASMGEIAGGVLHDFFELGVTTRPKPEDVTWDTGLYAA